MELDWVDVVGGVGSVLVLSMFLLNLWEKISTTSMLYRVANIVGGAGLFIYALLRGSWPFVPIEFCWALAPLYLLMRGRRR